MQLERNLERLRSAEVRTDIKTLNALTPLFQTIGETIQDLPDVYEGVYQVDNPPSYTTVTFTIVGQERTVSTTVDETTGQEHTSYGPWYPQTYTWTDRVSTNFTRHCQMISEVVKAGQAYRRSPTKPVLY